MNCDEYREAIGADPRFDGGAGHVAGCQACRDYRAAIVDLDGKIARALAIDVPPLAMPELPEIETGNVVTLRRRLSPPGWLAVAATVVLAAFVAVRMLAPGQVYASLADEVLAHMGHEPDSLRVTDEAVPDGRLRSVVAGDVAEFDQEKALITYAQTCVINGRDVPHLVMQGERGPVTILLMPEEKVAGAVPLDDATWHGVILPVGNGSIAIIGGRDEAIDDVEQTVLNSVTWTT